jgi:cobaltochelatase CobS
LWDSLFEDESDSEAKAKQDALRRQMAEAEEAEKAARKKQAEAERLRKELDELRKKQEAKRKAREEEERKRREEEEMKNLRHYKTDDLIETLRATGLAYLVGPAGTGKSTLAMDACVELFGVPKDDFKFNEHFAQISFSPDTTSGEMVGRCDINGVFHRSEVVRVFAEGGLILFDEIDNADASMLVKLNTAIANGTFATPEGLVRRNKNTVIVCTANTYGTGPDAMYVGRTRLDAATLDRFVCSTIEVDYDVKLEKKLAHYLPAEKRQWLDNFVKTVRKEIKEKHFRRLCSTRFVINAIRWFNQGKESSFIRDRFLIGWTDAEKSNLASL